MCSVAFVSETGPTLIDDWRMHHFINAQAAIKKTLAGVGEPSTDVPEPGTVAFITRRLCRPDERERVTERYLTWKG